MNSERASKVVLPKAVVGLGLFGWWVMLWLGGTGPALGLGLGDRAGDPVRCGASSIVTAYYDYDAFGSTLRVRVLLRWPTVIALARSRWMRRRGWFIMATAGITLNSGGG
jgi:hypothetical protein